ncbi:hypothetical protein [Lujinxingia sediminis]|uniref:hypothetical protein n=1 Tax=Lujinxingia sediminis TaxID=2480984 RepID=UPI0013E3A893|nr:hypothetical protein [Lujinxingia sediminis]
MRRSTSAAAASSPLVNTSPPEASPRKNCAAIIAYLVEPPGAAFVHVEMPRDDPYR